MIDDRLAQAEADEVSRGVGRVAIGDIIRRSAQRFGDKIAVNDGQFAASYAELDRDSNCLANYLIARELGANARVATLCKNSISFIKIIAGINKSGRVWLPLNVMLSVADIDYIIENAQPELIFIDEDLLKTPDLAELLAKRGISIVPVFCTGGAVPEVAQFHPDSEPIVTIHERDVALIMYTSGTTARAKGAMHCHLALYMTILNDIGEWSVTRDDQILISLPLFHCAGHTMTWVLLAAGGTVHLRSGFDPVDSVETIAREGVTMTFALPMMYDAMLKVVMDRVLDMSSLRLSFYAMAPMPRTLLESLGTNFCSRLALVSGQTEIYPMTVMFRPEHQFSMFGPYWGESATIDDLAIMSDDGKFLPDGEIGEIVHRGPNVMLGYFRDPVATEEARRYGWHHTGDLGFIDENGQLVFCDRKKDMIKSGGENVPSILVEEAMLRHPAVANAAAVGLPHPRWGEAIFVFVTLKSAVAADEAVLMDHARANLGTFQVPKGLKILDAMPLTASGKCRKAELRAEYMEYFAASGTP